MKSLGRQVGLFRGHTNIQKIYLQFSYRITKKNGKIYGNKDSTKKLHSFISLVIP